MIHVVHYHHESVSIDLDTLCVHHIESDTDSDNSDVGRVILFKPGRTMQMRPFLKNPDPVMTQIRVILTRLDFRVVQATEFSSDRHRVSDWDKMPDF